MLHSCIVLFREGHKSLRIKFREMVFLSISAVASPDAEPTDTVDQIVDTENQVTVY